MDLIKGEFLTWLWRKQPDGYYCQTFRPLSGGFHDMWWQKNGRHFNPTVGEGYPDFTWEEPYDWYFCPAGFDRMSRKKDFVLPSRWLFCDLDWTHPKDLPMTPTQAWETSPGKWQAVWLLQRPVEPQEFRHLNRAINHASGADPGTWNVNRLLRVPGSMHLKAERLKLRAA
jgi:hypothetical protein